MPFTVAWERRGFPCQRRANVIFWSGNTKKRGDFDHDVHIPSPGRLLSGDAGGGG